MSAAHLRPPPTWHDDRMRQAEQDREDELRAAQADARQRDWIADAGEVGQ